MVTAPHVNAHQPRLFARCTHAAVLVVGLLLTGCSGSNPTAPSPPAPAPIVTPPAPVPPPVPIVPPPVVRGPQFSQIFWNEFVHDSLESSAPQPLRRKTSAPSLYLRTLDEAGVAMDAVTLDTVQGALQDVAATWMGGQFGFVTVQRGTSSMIGVPGWITVRWAAAASTDNLCGRTAVNGDAIELDYRTPGCDCGGASRIYPRVARHELGHALGYYHTDSASDVMYGGTVDRAACNLTPSPREVYHATVAYSSPIGTLD